MNGDRVYEINGLINIASFLLFHWFGYDEAPN